VKVTVGRRSSMLMGVTTYDEESTLT
jgi:hypothetical protein